MPDDWYWFFHRGVRAAACVALLSLGDDAGAGFLTELAEKNHDVFFAWFAPAILRIRRRSPAVSALKARLTVDALMETKPGSTRFTNPGTAAMVAEALGVIGTRKARTHLRSLATSSSRYVRAAACIALLARGARSDDRRFVIRLAETDPTDFVKISASFALARAGERSWAEEIARLAGTADNPFDTASAIGMLGDLGEKRYAEAVRRYLKHADWYVRQRCVETLGALGGKPAQVKQALKDPCERVRLSAARVMAAREDGA